MYKYRVLVDKQKNKALKIAITDCEASVALSFAIMIAFDALRLYETLEGNPTKLRGAIQTLEDVQNGYVSVRVSREAAFYAHQVARECKTIEGAFAARAIGHACATAHVRKHAYYAYEYLLKAYDESQQGNAAELQGAFITMFHESCTTP